MPQVGAIIGGIALNLAIGIGASVLSGLLAPKQSTAPTVNASTTSGFSFQVEFGEAVPVRAIVGLGRATGQALYLNTYGDNNGYLQYVIKAGHGWHDGLDTFLVNEKPVTLAGSNGDAMGRSVVEWTRDGTPYLWVKYYTGAPGQVADAELIANANPAGRWTSAHKLTGCAYIIITCRYDADFYGSTMPTFGQVWRGLRLFDLRSETQTWGDQSTYTFTQNPAVIRWNYRRGIFVNGVRVLGMGLPAFANDQAGYIAAANRCDETYYDPITETTWPVFEYGREIGDDETKLTVLSELDASYCGSSFKRGGGDVPLPAQQMVSTLTLTDNDRLKINQGSRQTVHADLKGTVSSKKTCWSGQFISSDLGYALGAYTARIDTDLESVIGGRRSVTMDQPYETLQGRAQFRAEVALRRQFYPATRTETFTPKALVLEPGDCVTRQSEWGSTMMLVEQVQQLSDRAGVIVTMSQWDNAIVPASGDSFVVLPTGPGAGVAPADRTIAVSGLAVVAYPKAGGGAVHPYGRATWTAITDPAVEQVMIRTWPAAGTEANDGQDYFASSKLTSALLLGPLAPDTAYTGYAIPIRNDGRLTVKTNPFTLTSGDEIAPLAATVPDNSIEAGKLVVDLQNRVGAVLDQVTAALADFDGKIGEQSEYIASVDANSQTSIRALTAKSNAASASIVEIREAVVSATSAMAELSDTVTANYNKLSAGGIISFEATAGTDGISTNVTMVVTASDGTTQVEAGSYTSIVSDGLGGFTSRTISIADKQYWTDDGTTLSQPMTYDATTGRLTVDEVDVNKVVSPSGKLTMDGTTANTFGEEYFQVG